MNNKKQDKKPLFAEVNLTGDEFRQSPSNHMQRTRFLKLVYPNGVTLILPGDTSASQLEQYIHRKRNPCHGDGKESLPVLSDGRCMRACSYDVLFINNGEHLADGNIHRQG